LLDCKDKGFAPDYTICDGGKGLRAGQHEVMPDVPCNGDVFHIEMEIGKVSRMPVTIFAPFVLPYNSKKLIYWVLIAR